MRPLPETPPPRMTMPMAIEFARRGYHVRPLSWTGAEDGHALAWLHYPAGFPLAYYYDGTQGRRGRKWRAGDLARADWFGWWTALPPDCFVGEAAEELCLCDAGDANWLWSWTAFPDDATVFGELANPNARMGIEGCGSGCHCAGGGTDGGGGGSAGGGAGPTVPFVPGGPGSPSSPGLPAPGGPASPGSPGGGGGSGNPQPGGGGSGGGGSGAGMGSGGGKDRDPKPKPPGPVLSVSAIRTAPESCATDAQPQPHTWAIEVSLSGPSGVAEGIYSVQLRVLSTTVGTWMLSPGGSASTTYSRSMAADSTPIPAIATGSAFGGGPGCTPGSAELEPSRMCTTTSSEPPSYPSTVPPSFSSNPGSEPPPSSYSSHYSHEPPPTTTPPTYPP